MASTQDRLDIIETCTRMAWYADHRECERLGEIFADATVLDYTSLNGGEPVTVSPEQIGSAWAQALGRFEATQHLITNHLVTVAGDAAVCTAAFQATHRKGTPLGASLWTLGGIYRFELTRTGETWKIAAVVMTATWGDGNQGLVG
ncbi:nuclear transport factor 2 family protein [Nocardia stercoris]|uniref:Nuclear transport factor 2 family protein n=1 Tax=Nocardia stercoris TaxID=2483361 RepID=A0A3M2KUR8_9NOCA|nr:nuclear transport factor 2 family protein [Nocardia stercoris]RMI28901.1 nuclear transport factor 2 family protein [Nocardia stercoris]